MAHQLFTDLKFFGRSAAKSVSKSSISEARSKLPWQALEHLLGKANTCEGQWRGHTLRAVDGTYLQLPSSPSTQTHFPQRKCDLYPRCRLMTAFNAITLQPTHARVDDLFSSELFQIDQLLPLFHQGDLLLLDRGFHSVDLWTRIVQLQQHFLCRIRSGPLAQQLLASGKKDLLVTLKGLKVRLLKQGHLIIATSLTSSIDYRRKELIALYKRRWTAETQYKRLKQTLSLQKFHSTSHNGVMQEIFAGLLMLSLMAAASHAATKDIAPNYQINFQAVTELTWARLPLLILGTGRLRTDRRLLKELLEILKIFTEKLRPGRHFPRVSKQPENKWIKCRRQHNHVRKDHWKWSDRYR